MADNIKNRLEIIRSHIKSYPDFPKPGIIFRDIFSILKKPQLFKDMMSICVEHVKTIPCVDAVVGLDARGFLMAPMLALELQVPFIPLRKKGKLPGKVQSISYKLEYGEDTLEIQCEDLENISKVIIFDDLLASGGTLATACKLLEKCNIEVLQCLVAIELKDLKGKDRISAPVHNLFEF